MTFAGQQKLPSCNSPMPVHFPALRIQLHCLVSQARNAFTSVSAVIPAVFTASVAKKPHNSLTNPELAVGYPSGVALPHYIGATPSTETFMTRHRSEPRDTRLKRWIFASIALAALAGSPALAADEPDLIFRRSTV